MQHKLILLRCMKIFLADVSRGNYRPGKLGCGESRLWEKGCGENSTRRKCHMGTIARGKQAWGKCPWGSEPRPMLN